MNGWPKKILLALGAVMAFGVGGCLSSTLERIVVGFVV
jgi:hypothetical protein